MKIYNSEQNFDQDLQKLRHFYMAERIDHRSPEELTINAPCTMKIFCTTFMVL